MSEWLQQFALPIQRIGKRWQWSDPNDRTWYFYHPLGSGTWIYRRDDHQVSSVRFSSLREAVKDLSNFFPT